MADESNEPETNETSGNESEDRSDNDLKVHVVAAEGAGRPVVLIHGWPLSSESWSEQTAALKDARLPGGGLRPPRFREVRPRRQL